MGVQKLWLPKRSQLTMKDNNILQGSRWTFQAARMDGTLGSSTIKPDQMQLINPALVLFLIPLFDRVIYPAFAK